MGGKNHTAGAWVSCWAEETERELVGGNGQISGPGIKGPAV